MRKLVVGELVKPGDFFFRLSGEKVVLRNKDFPPGMEIKFGAGDLQVYRDDKSSYVEPNEVEFTQDECRLLLEMIDRLAKYTPSKSELFASKDEFSVWSKLTRSVVPRKE